MYHQIGIYAIVFMVTLNTIAVVYCHRKEA